MIGPRNCEARNRVGEPCGASPLKAGTMIDGIKVSGRWCRAHDPELPDSARIQGAQPGAGRPRKPRVHEVIRQRLEEKIDEIFDGLWEATDAMRAVVVGNGPTARIVEVPDHPTRIMAYREILDRGLGRPKLSGEITVITEDMILREIERMERELARDNDGRDRREPGDNRALQAGAGEA